MTVPWQRLETLATLASPWVTILLERWQDERGAHLDYWRVERAHSVIVLPIHQERLLLPRPQFRPGVDGLTLDFPGGRLPANMAPLEAAPAILQRELGVTPGAIAALQPINQEGWMINSSFSNQRLFGVIANLAPDATIPPEQLDRAVPCRRQAVAQLLAQLSCLQCRAVLQEYVFHYLLDGG